jgi:hypothetical protein
MRISDIDRETEMLSCLQQATDRIPECDDIVIVLQKKGEDEGQLWFAPASTTYAASNWLIDCLKAHLFRDAKGESE